MKNHQQYEMTSPAETFARMAENEEFLGFGYIGGRDGEETELVARADAAVITRATELGWSDEDLFEWANSKPGRWFADGAFGGSGLDLRLIRLP